MARHITIGNTAQRIDGRKVRWSFYARSATEYVEEIVVTLHPTFKNPVRTLTGPNFTLACNGWGTFPLGVLIRWKGGQESAHTWHLQFDSADANELVEVPATAITAAAASSPEDHAGAADDVDDEEEDEDADDDGEDGNGGGRCPNCGGNPGGGVEDEDSCLCGVDLSHDYRVNGCWTCKGLYGHESCTRPGCSEPTCRCSARK